MRSRPSVFVVDGRARQRQRAVEATQAEPTGAELRPKPPQVLTGCGVPGSERRQREVIHAGIDDVPHSHIQQVEFALQGTRELRQPYLPPFGNTRIIGREQPFLDEPGQDTSLHEDLVGLPPQHCLGLQECPVGHSRSLCRTLVTWARSAGNDSNTSPR